MKCADDVVILAKTQNKCLKVNIRIIIIAQNYEIEVNSLFVIKSTELPKNWDFSH